MGILERTGRGPLLVLGLIGLGLAAGAFGTWWHERHERPAPAAARKNIGQTEPTYAPFPPAASNALADFFTQSPYWGILLIVAVVVVVVALLVLRRRHRPRRVPPPPPSP